MLYINVARLPTILRECGGQYQPLLQCTAYWSKC